MSSERTYGKLDAAFAWGYISRCPTNDGLVELLVDSELEIPSDKQSAIRTVLVQLDIYYREQYQKGRDDGPDLIHISQLTTICGSIFRDITDQNVVACYQLGCAIGEVFGKRFWQKGESTADELEAIRRAIDSLPRIFHPAIGDLSRLLDQCNPAALVDSVKLISPGKYFGPFTVLDHIEKQLRLIQDPDVVAASSRVKLFERTHHPVALIDGQKIDKLTPARYVVIRTLLEAYPGGLHKDQLNKKAKKSDARKILKALVVADKRWRPVIVFAGVAGKGYRIL